MRDKSICAKAVLRQLIDSRYSLRADSLHPITYKKVIHSLPGLRFFFLSHLLFISWVFMPIFTLLWIPKTHAHGVSYRQPPYRNLRMGDHLTIHDIGNGAYRGLCTQALILLDHPHLHLDYTLMPCINHIDLAFSDTFTLSIWCV